MTNKEKILHVATRLFAVQGFYGTSIKQITLEVGVTEPLLYYHFDGKDDLFTDIIKTTFVQYHRSLDAIEEPAKTQFEKLERFISLHFKFVAEFPYETYLIVSACPAKLRESSHICANLIGDQGRRLERMISTCLKKGMASGEFRKIQLKATTSLIIAMLNGLLRRRSLKLESIRGLEKATIDFCRSALLNKEKIEKGLFVKR
jgi:AcrR family transcriptional regulator